MNNTLNTIQFGSVIRIWHGSRGHDYIFCGLTEDKNSALLLKNNCINQDGSIHAATKRFHKTLALTKMAKKKYTVSGVSRICGLRPSVVEQSVLSFAKAQGMSIKLPKAKATFVCPTRQETEVLVTYEE